MKNFTLQAIYVNKQSFVSKKGNLVSLSNFITELGPVQVFDEKDREQGTEYILEVSLVNYGGKLNVRTTIQDS